MPEGRARPAERAGGPGTMPDASLAIALGGSLVANLGEVMLGTPGALTAAAVAALSGGHLLIEDVPGVGKTVLAKALALSLGAELSRVQGHP
ncbi:MAG TPA: AAA family ATPase, partial [Acidimicrobiales bacterium]|nr:AAA family ATPase [Acidimicrobiales bacterium]